MADLSDIFVGSEFALFRTVLGEGGKIKGFAVPGCAGYTRSQLGELTDFVRSRGAKGLVTMALEGNPGEPVSALAPEKVRSVVAKFLKAEQIVEIARRLKAKAGDLLLIVADKPKLVDVVLNSLRLEMGRRLNLADPNLLAFAFILDFPLFDWIEEEKRWDSMHHPFTSPHP
jgi:aspartyl-tRNA synthetase